MQIHHKIYLKIVPNREKNMYLHVSTWDSVLPKGFTFVDRAVCNNFTQLRWTIRNHRRHPLHRINRIHRSTRDERFTTTCLLPVFPSTRRHPWWTSTYVTVDERWTIWWTRNVSWSTGRFAGSCTVVLTTQAKHYGDNSNGVLEYLNCDVGRYTPSCKYIVLPCVWCARHVL